MKIKNLYLIEIIIWLLIIGSLFYFFVYTSTIKENVQNSYYLFFDDAGGLVKGSPVRLMGINIGYVRDVKIFDNKVFVSFLVTKDNVNMPKQAIASVEFYGLGGSTSLELIPNKSIAKEDQEIILPVESYRIQDFWDGQELVANVMIDIYGGIGRTIQSADLINNKSWFKQSNLVKEISNQTSVINTAQSVMIYKLTEATLNYSIQKQEEKNRIDESNEGNVLFKDVENYKEVNDNE